MSSNIDLHKLLLLEEGHCLRNQVFDLCELKKNDFESNRLQYEAGSIETLKNLADHHKVITILPYLATLDLTKKQKAKIRDFAHPKPVHEICLVVNINFHQSSMLDSLRVEIENQLPPSINKTGEKRILGVQHN